MPLSFSDFFQQIQIGRAGRAKGEKAKGLGLAIEIYRRSIGWRGFAPPYVYEDWALKKSFKLLL